MAPSKDAPTSLPARRTPGLSWIAHAGIHVHKWSVQVVPPIPALNIPGYALKNDPQLCVFCTSLGPHSLLEADDEGWKQWFWRPVVALTLSASPRVSPSSQPGLR